MHLNVFYQRHHLIIEIKHQTGLVVENRRCNKESPSLATSNNILECKSPFIFAINATYSINSGGFKIVLVHNKITCSIECDRLFN